MGVAVRSMCGLITAVGRHSNCLLCSRVTLVTLTSPHCVITHSTENS